MISVDGRRLSRRAIEISAKVSTRIWVDLTPIVTLAAGYALIRQRMALDYFYTYDKPATLWKSANLGEFLRQLQGDDLQVILDALQKNPEQTHDTALAWRNRVSDLVRLLPGGRCTGGCGRHQDW